MCYSIQFQQMTQQLFGAACFFVSECGAARPSGSATHILFQHHYAISRSGTFPGYTYSPATPSSGRRYPVAATVRRGTQPGEGWSYLGDDGSEPGRNHQHMDDGGGLKRQRLSDAIIWLTGIDVYQRFCKGHLRRGPAGALRRARRRLLAGAAESPCWVRCPAECRRDR